MADRRPFSFRFWSSGSSSTPRRTSTTANQPPPPKPEPQNNNESIANNAATSNNPPAVETTIAASSTPPSVETKSSAGQSTTAASPLAPTTPPRAPLSSQVQKASQTTSNASSHPTSEPEPEPQTSSASRPIARSPSLSKPASPSRRTTLTRPPSQPSSPSRAAPPARSPPSSSRAGPPKASQPPSPSRLASNSPKQASPNSTKGTQPTSPSKESLGKTRGISNDDEAPPALTSNKKEPKSAASQEETLEPQPKDDVKSEIAANHFNPIQKIESSTINDGDKPEETKEVKEVMQVANTEANNEIVQKKVYDVLTPISGSDANEPDNIHKEKQEALNEKEILPISLPHVKPNSQPKNRTMISHTHKKSALPSGENVPLHKEIKDGISTFVNKMAIGDPKRVIYDKHVSVITLAGENKGAFMEMGSNSSKRERKVHIHRGYKINHEESAETTTDEEGSSRGKKQEDGKAAKVQPTEACVNNNAQGINNSIVFDSCVAERNPGVHMIVNHVQKESTESIEKPKGVEARNAESHILQANRHTYEPTIRRRCLQGLLLETSDSDPEKPEKPRRHGCRVGYKGNKGKEKDVDVL